MGVRGRSPRKNFWGHAHLVFRKRPFMLGNALLKRGRSDSINPGTRASTTTSAFACFLSRGKSLILLRTRSLKSHKNHIQKSQDCREITEKSHENVTKSYLNHKNSQRKSCALKVMKISQITYTILRSDLPFASCQYRHFRMPCSVLNFMKKKHYNFSISVP